MGMSRFRSRLFNWIERSLPVQLGRKARKIFDKITAELAEKLAQTIDKLEQQTSTTPLQSSVKKLLRPAKALVKFFAKHSGVQRSATTGQIDMQKDGSAISYTPQLSEAREGGYKSHRFGELHELIIRAISYFQRKKRTLPAPSLPSATADRMMVYSAMGAEQTLPWLDPLETPKENVPVATAKQPIDPWEADLDEHCMRAWIETQATFLGYEDSPIIKFLLWLDRIIYKIEQCLIALWQKLVHWWESKFSKV